MSSPPIGHSTALRAIGQLFDADRARNVSVEEEPQAVALSWQIANGAAKTARYQWSELDRLWRAEQAQRSNGTIGRTQRMPTALPWSELLRTLGQDLDAEQAETSSITGDVTFLTASWLAGDRFRTRQYTGIELWDASRRRAALHQPTG